MALVYNLNEFQSIKSSGFEYTIPDDARELITLLANLVGSPNYSKSPYFIKQDKKKKKITQANSNIGWEMLRNFKKTELKNKNDIEKKIDAIRILMNKLTAENYDKVKDLILKDLTELHIEDDIENQEAENIFNKVISVLFTIASSNQFFSHLYAKLYTDISKQFTILNIHFNNTLKGYLELFKNIESCNPDEDYNKFCEINQQNDHRRSISAFITNCMMLGNIELKIIIDIIFMLQTMMLDSINDIMKIEEITENYFILVTVGLNKIVLSDEWGTIYENIQDNSKNKSFNNKIRFKFMDLLDLTS
tara:strand:- start:11216 stop:12133 length:918 start_codon:yes stop_codon:yes gene_type:complete